MRLNTVIYDSSGNCRVAAKCTLPLVFTNLSHIFHLAASNFKQHRPSRVKMINRRCTAAPNNKKTFSSEFHFIKFVFRFATNALKRPREQAAVYVQQVERRVAAVKGELLICTATCSPRFSFLCGSCQIEISQNVATKSAHDWS